MARHDHCGMERRNAVERRGPAPTRGRVGLGSPHVDPAVEDVSRHDRLERRNPHEGVHGIIALDRADDLELLTLERDGVAGERRRNHRCRCDRVAVERLPLCDLGLPGPLDAGDSARQRHKSRSGKRLLDHFETEVVIGMVMGDVDGREILAAGADRCDDAARVGAGEGGVDQDGIARAGDQGRVHEEAFGRGSDDL